ncbi:MAG TPA: NUDIX domain-containing protein [Phycisphaerae bacterium]|nr:NUDIX domain-containing protein [Phycisphaerae bacterium]
MARQSAGILLYRRGVERGAGVGGSALEVLLVHPGGPFWKNKDAGAWTIPKGEVGEGEDPRSCAVREFAEELGTGLEAVAEGELRELPVVKQKGGKVVRAWACRGNMEVGKVRSNTFRMEWPPRSGKFVEFPEVDRAAWFGIAEAREKINPAQSVWLEWAERQAPNEP